MAFNIIVCVKQVPDSDKVKINPKTGSLIRKGVPGVLNGDDSNALEAALQLKDNFKDVHITAVTMGPPQAREVLFESIAMGADEGILINDRALANSDTFVTAEVLARAINKWASTDSRGFDLVITGRESTDGDTAQVGPELAERLDIPQVTYASEIAEADSAIAESSPSYNGAINTLNITRALDGIHEEVQVNTPCLITAIGQLNQPRYPHMRNIFAPKKITEWNIADLDLTEDQVGLEGSPSLVMSSFTMKKSKGGLFVEGENGNEQALNLLEHLKSNHLI